MKFGRLLAWLALALAVPLTAATDRAAPLPASDIPAGPAQAAPEAPVQSRPDPFAGRRDYIRREVEIPMRDGVRLHTVLILPRHARRAPIMLDRTPYSADEATRGGYGPSVENMLMPAYAELVRAGYIVAIQDVRGKYRSGGDYVMNRPLAGPLNPTGIDHSTDAFDTIDWLVKNVPEARAAVATIGTSYNGFTALMSLVNPHPALKAAVPINPMVDVWRGDDWFHGGAFRQQMMGFVLRQTGTRWGPGRFGSGHDDDYETFLSHTNAEGYARAIGMDRLPFWQRLLQHPDYDDYWRAQALDRILAGRGLSVPTLIVGGLWDQEDIYGAPALFAALQSSPNAFLALGPWYHGQVNYPAREYGPIDLGSDSASWFRSNVMIPFLDRHLKGRPGPDIAKVTAFEAGTNVWRRHDRWPLACKSQCPAGLTPLYLSPVGKAGFAQPAAPGFSSYVSDPASPVPYRPRPILPLWALGSTWRNWLFDDQRFVAGRSDVISFTGEVLTEPLRLAGTPLVHLVASTSGSDSDWVVKLIDVYPASVRSQPELDGYQLAIAMDVLRARYRGDPGRPTAVPPDAAVTYEFALPDVDYVVQPGHRLMIQVQSSWFPLYDRNPQTFVPSIFTARKGDYRAATQRVFTGPQGSWIGLPVVR